MSNVVEAAISAVVASAAAPAIMGMLGGDQTPTANGPRIGELDPVKVSEGGRMWRAAGCGKVRTSCQVAWSSKVHEKKTKASVGTGKSAGAVNTYSYSVDLVVMIGQAFEGTDGKGAIEKLWQIKCNGKTIYNAKKPGKGKHRYASLALRLGTESQPVMGVLEAAKGSGKVSAFRNTAGFGFNELKLADFGNGIPQVFDAIWQPDPYPYTVADAITAIWLRSPGRTSGEIDVSGVTGKNTVDADDLGNRCLQGMIFNGPESPLRMLDALAVAYDFAHQETNGVVRFFDRGDETVIEIDDDLLGADVGTPEVRRQPLSIRDRADNSLPSEVVVNYFDEDQAWKRASVRVKVDNPPSGENIVEIDLPFTFEREQARRICRRRAWEPYLFRHEVELNLPPDFIDVQEADVLAVPFNGQRYYIRVLKKTIGANWLIQIEGVVLDTRAGSDQILSSVAGSWNGDLEDTLDALDPTDGDDDDDYSPPVVRTVLANLPAITDEETELYGFWLAHAADDIDAIWIASTLFRSTKAGGKYKEIPSESVWKETTIGFVLNALPDSTAKWGWWDTINHLDVQFFEGAAASVDEEDVRAGANWLAVGTGNNFEVIAFRTATVIEEVSITLTAAEFVAPDLLIDLTADFVAGDVQVGRYIRIVGGQEEANADVFRKVLAVTTTTIQIETTATTELVAEGPLTSPVEVTQGSTYRLTNLLRGLRNTEEHAAQHTTDDMVIPFELADAVFMPHPQSETGKTRYFKDVPEGLEPADVASTSFASLSETLRCFSPSWLQARRVGGTDNKNAVIKWLHRTRLTNNDQFPVQHHDLLKNEAFGKHGDRTKFRVTIWKDAGHTMKARSFDVVAQDDHDEQTVYFITATYTTAQQVVDGTFGFTIYVQVQQIAKPPVVLGNSSYITVP